MAEERQRLQELRGQHVGRLLIQAQRAFNARAVEMLRARGYGALTLAHIALVPYIDVDGTRITTLAERAGMTKQGAGQLITDLERQGYVARHADPADRRAILVQFTDAGQQFIADAVTVTHQLDAEYTAILGAPQMAGLRAALQALVEHSQQRG